MIIADRSRQEHSDAELAAFYAKRCLEEGRYELAAELARIARNAHRAHLQTQFREDQDACVHEQIHQAQDNAATALMRPIRTFEGSRAPQTCRAPMRIDVTPHPGAEPQYMDGASCNAPIAWQPGRFGDGRVDPETAGWQHIDPEIDNNHVAEPSP